MRVNLFGTIVMSTTLALSGTVAVNAQQTGAGSGSGQSQTQGAGQGQGWRGRGGIGGFPGGGRGVLGAVTEIAADHYTIKTDSGETYTVHFSVNTRIIKEPAGRRQGGRERGDAENGDRTQPQTIKPTDIKVGDVITAGGEMDAAAKSIGAVFIAQVDPERAKQMREMQANYGKTWLAGRITSIDGTTITIQGIVDQASHSIAVDENTSFRQRRESITLADIKPGQQLRAEGAVKGGVFLATTVNAMQPQNRGEGRDQAPDSAPSGSQPKPQ
jgi:hypothetical protein